MYVRLRIRKKDIKCNRNPNNIVIIGFNFRRQKKKGINSLRKSCQLTSDVLSHEFHSVFRTVVDVSAGPRLFRVLKKTATILNPSLS